MSDLPNDLEEEVLSRVPVKYIRKVRLTCQKWNTFSKHKNFAKKHLGQATSKKFMVAVILDFRIHLMSINLHDNVESFIQPEGKLISVRDSYEVDLARVFHYDGLLLCITKSHTKLVVWNPYWCQIWCIKPTLDTPRLECYSHVIRYNKSSHSYKILIFIDWPYRSNPFVEIKIYDLKSDSWRVLDVPPDRQIDFYYHGPSLKGDTYWFARNKLLRLNFGGYLVCFDFTKEQFGPLLPMSIEWYHRDTAILSSVRKEKLAVLFQRRDMLTLEIWITTMI